MKNFFQFGSLVVSVFLATAAYANSTTCSSSDGRLQFARSQSNGGPAMGPRESLVLDGETLISITFPGGTQIVRAQVNFADQPVWSKTSEGGNTRTTLYVTNLEVSRNDVGTAVPAFNDLVFCRSDVYIGPPIP